jgi:hypothetical protein
MNILSHYVQIVILAGMTLLGLLRSLNAEEVHARAADCFPFESLPDPLRERAEQLLLRGLDSEALYTIAADIKPMSSGFELTAARFYNKRGVYILGLIIFITVPAILKWRYDWRSYWKLLITAVGCSLMIFGLFRVALLPQRNADELEQIMRTWKCGGEIVGRLHRFKSPFDGTPQMMAYAFNIPLMAKTITEHADLFAPLNVSPSSAAIDIISALQRKDRSTMHRGFGLLYGYPEDAINFFVDAEKQRQATGEFIKRDFVSLPTFDMFQGEYRFVYAVLKGAGRTKADYALAARVQPVFDEYLKRRARHIHDDSGAGVLSLVREWFDDGTGNVRPSNAWRRNAFAGNL